MNDSVRQSLTLALGAVFFGAIGVGMIAVVAATIHEMIRRMNERDDPQHAKRPPAPP